MLSKMLMICVKSLVPQEVWCLLVPGNQRYSVSKTLRVGVGGFLFRPRVMLS